MNLDYVVETDLSKYFNYLISENGFKKIPEYSFTREIFNDYVNENLLIKFIFDGTLRINIKKIKQYEKSNIFSEVNHKRIIKLNESYNKKEILDIYNSPKNFDNQALLIKEVLHQNLDLVNGKLFKLTRLYQLIKI